jgi:flagellar motor switch protein FliG
VAEQAGGQQAGPGAIRAAALLMGLGPELAVEIFKLLDEATVRQIALGARVLRRKPEAVGQALTAFVQSMGSVNGQAALGDEVLREVATKALGADIARRAFDGITPAPPADEVLGALGNADPETLALLLSREQPQTAALVLGAMDTARASAVMKHVPEAQRPQILRRLSALEVVAPEVLREVAGALASDISAAVPTGTRRVDGKALVIEVLRGAAQAQQSALVAEIEKDDPELAEELRGKLFTFEDLANLADRDVQTLIREIDMGQLSIALKGGSNAVKDKLLKNMSSRAAQMLNDDVAAMGPVKLAAVEAAQATLVKTAFSLAEQGRLTIVGPADKMM